MSTSKIRPAVASAGKERRLDSFPRPVELVFDVTARGFVDVIIAATCLARELFKPSLREIRTVYF